MLKEALTIAGTVLSGVIIYTGGQIIQEFYLKPLREQKRVIGNISHHLVYYGNKVFENEARDAFRTDASNLIESTYQIPNYKFLQEYGWWLFGKLPTIDGIRVVKGELIGISNIDDRGAQGFINLSDSMKKIKRILHIKDR